MRFAAFCAEVVGRLRGKRHSEDVSALIVDPALHAMGGHHYAAAKSLVSEFSNLQIKYTTLGSLFADERVRFELGVKQCFDRSMYGQRDLTQRGFIEHVESARALITRHIRWMTHKPDLVVLPCCDQVLAAAIGKCIRSFPDWRPRVLLWLLFPPQSKISDEDLVSNVREIEYREAFGMLKTSVPNDSSLMIYCETEPLALIYRHLLGLEILVGAGPTPATQTSINFLRRNSKDVTIVCIGYANAAKGYGLLPGAVRRVLQTKSNVRFMIHGTRTQLDADDDFAAFDELKAMGSRVIVNNGVLENDDYFAWFQRADLLLLPYDPIVYGVRGSGVFTEATCLGIPAIVTAACGFAQAAFAESRAVPIEKYDSDGIYLAIIAALNSFPILASRAREKAHDLSVNSATAEALRKLLDSKKDRTKP